MFGGSYFAGDQFGGRHFYAGGASATGRVRSYWAFGGRAFANRSLDYWVIDSLDTVIASGSGTTDASGWLEMTVPTRYSGQSVLVVVNNLGADMDTSGKAQGQQVTTVA